MNRPTRAEGGIGFEVVATEDQQQLMATTTRELTYTGAPPHHTPCVGAPSSVATEERQRPLATTLAQETGEEPIESGPKPDLIIEKVAISRSVDTFTRHSKRPASSKGLFRAEESDLFLAGPQSALIHCVSSDGKMSAGIATTFSALYGDKKALNWTVVKPGTAVLYKSMRGRYIIYLVTKRSYSGKPTFLDFKRSLKSATTLSLRHGITQWACPAIGCGRDGLIYDDVMQTLKELVCDRGVSVTVHVPKSVWQIQLEDERSVDLIRSTEASASGTPTEMVSILATAPPEASPHKPVIHNVQTLEAYNALLEDEEEDMRSQQQKKELVASPLMAVWVPATLIAMHYEEHEPEPDTKELITFLLTEELPAPHQPGENLTEQVTPSVVIDTQSPPSPVQDLSSEELPQTLEQEEQSLEDQRRTFVDALIQECRQPTNSNGLSQHSFLSALAGVSSVIPINDVMNSNSSQSHVDEMISQASEHQVSMVDPHIINHKQSGAGDAGRQAAVGGVLTRTFLPAQTKRTELTSTQKAMKFARDIAGSPERILGLMLAGCRNRAWTVAVCRAIRHIWGDKKMRQPSLAQDTSSYTSGGLGPIGSACLNSLTKGDNQTTDGKLVRTQFLCAVRAWSRGDLALASKELKKNAANDADRSDEDGVWTENDSQNMAVPLLVAVSPAVLALTPDACPICLFAPLCSGSFESSGQEFHAAIPLDRLLSLAKANPTRLLDALAAKHNREQHAGNGNIHAYAATSQSREVEYEQATAGAAAVSPGHVVEALDDPALAGLMSSSIQLVATNVDSARTIQEVQYSGTLHQVFMELTGFPPLPNHIPDQHRVQYQVDAGVRRMIVPARHEEIAVQRNAVDIAAAVAQQGFVNRVYVQADPAIIAPEPEQQVAEQQQEAPPPPPPNPGLGHQNEAVQVPPIVEPNGALVPPLPDQPLDQQQQPLDNPPVEDQQQQAEPLLQDEPLHPRDRYGPGAIPAVPPPIIDPPYPVLEYALRQMEVGPQAAHCIAEPLKWVSVARDSRMGNATLVNNLSLEEVNQAVNPRLAKTIWSKIVGAPALKQVLSSPTKGLKVDLRPLALRVVLMNLAKDKAWADPFAQNWLTPTTDHRESARFVAPTTYDRTLSAVFVTPNVLNNSLGNSSLSVPVIEMDGTHTTWNIIDESVQVIALDVNNANVDAQNIWIAAHLDYPRLCVVDQVSGINLANAMVQPEAGGHPIRANAPPRRQYAAVRNASLVRVPNIARRIIFVVTSAAPPSYEVNGHEFPVTHITNQGNVIPAQVMDFTNHADNIIGSLMDYPSSLIDLFDFTLNAIKVSAFDWKPLHDLASYLTVRYPALLQFIQTMPGEAPGRDDRWRAAGAPREVLDILGLQAHNLNIPDTPAGHITSVLAFDHKLANISKAIRFPVCTLGTWSSLAELALVCGMCTYLADNAKPGDQPRHLYNINSYSATDVAINIRKAYETWAQAGAVGNAILAANANDASRQLSAALHEGASMNGRVKTPKQLLSEIIGNETMAWSWAVNESALVHLYPHPGRLNRAMWMTDSMQSSCRPSMESTLLKFQATANAWNSRRFCHPQNAEVDDDLALHRILFGVNSYETRGDIRMQQHPSGEEGVGASMILGLTDTSYRYRQGGFIVGSPQVVPIDDMILGYDLKPFVRSFNDDVFASLTLTEETQNLWASVTPTQGRTWTSLTLSNQRPETTTRVRQLRSGFRLVQKTPDTGQPTGGNSTAPVTLMELAVTDTNKDLQVESITEGPTG